MEVYSPILKVLLDQLNVRFREFFEIDNEKGKFAAVAAFTHPKFKAKWISALDDDAVQMVKNLVKEIVRPATPSVRELPNNEDDFFTFDNVEQNLFNDNFMPHCTEDELMRFLNNPSSSIEILKEYPVVQKIYMKFNTPLPSSAPVERLFSYDTLLNLAKYNKMSDEKFEKRVLCKINSNNNYL